MTRSASSGRTPDTPFAKPFARINIVARTTAGEARVPCAMRCVRSSDRLKRAWSDGSNVTRLRSATPVVRP